MRPWLRLDGMVITLSLLSPPHRDDYRRCCFYLSCPAQAVWRLQRPDSAARSSRHGVPRVSCPHSSAGGRRGDRTDNGLRTKMVRVCRGRSAAVQHVCRQPCGWRWHGDGWQARLFTPVCAVDAASDRDALGCRGWARCAVMVVAWWSVGVARMRGHCIVGCWASS